MMIEFATRNLQKYLGGITNQAYVSSTLNPDGVIKDIPSANTVKIAYDVNERPKYYFVGMNIKFADSVNTSRDFTTDVRKITSITEDDSYLVIEYDGEDLSNDLEVDTWGVYGMGQDNGLTDNLIYHTGRTNFTTIGTDITKKNLNNPFKYRNIENVYGNVWERLAGIRVKNLKAYINYEPNSYTINSSWKSANYTLPLQTQAGHASQAWIVEEHYDRNDPLVVLPSKVGSSNGGGDNKFYSDSFYSNNASNVEYEAVCGGAWDHYVFSGAFTIRVYINPGDQQWLNGNRPVIR